MNFIDNLRTLNFISDYDNSERGLLISFPLNFNKDKQYPLIISPHPFGWSNFENFYGGTADLLYAFKGWTGISERYKIIIALPSGHGRFHEKISLAWEAQIEDLISIPEILNNANIKINKDKMFICGLSMGGMETLTTLGKYPNILKAGFCFNAIADLNAWYNDVKQGNTDQKLVDMDILSLVNEELGGTPEELQEEYIKRSAVSYIDNLTEANLMIYWSSKESVVPNQENSQGKKLYDLIKLRNPNAKTYEHDHTYDHGFDKFGNDERMKCHEYSDFNLATKWFLENFS
jgi:predicted peptidase